MVAAPILADRGRTHALSRAVRRATWWIAGKIPYRIAHFWKGQLLAIGCTLAATAIRAAVSPLVGPHGIPVVVYYPFVVIASVWGGAASGFSVLVLGGLVSSVLWLPHSGNAVTLTAFSIACLSVILTTQLFRVLVERHVADEERAVLLAHELKHRTNNLLGLVLSLSVQTAKRAASVQEHQALFTSRIKALASAQELTADAAGLPLDLRTLVGRIIEPFGLDKFEIDGAATAMPQYHGSSFVLLLHELCTNATKYGALSVPDGRVTIMWTVQGENIRLEWRERGGPQVAPPDRAGFGTRLLKTAFPPDFGSAATSYDPDGVRCVVEFVLM